MSFPPAQPPLTEQIPAYLYVQYNDDDNVRAFFTAYNDVAQYYLDWFTTTLLPVYTSLTGSLLDWVGQGLYGIARPTLAAGGSAAKGTLNTIELDTFVLNYFKLGTEGSFSVATDDIYQRVMTWHLYKGDGKIFSMLWLKRRCLRFLLGTNGIDVNVADTSGISITIVASVVTIDVSAVAGVSSDILAAFAECIAGGILELPPQFQFEVTT